MELSTVILIDFSSMKTAKIRRDMSSSRPVSGLSKVAKHCHLYGAALDSPKVLLHSTLAAYEKAPPI